MNHQYTPSPRAAARTCDKSLRVALGLALGALVLGTAGCYARARGGVVVEEPTVEVETAPVAVETVPVAEIEYYPAHVYGGTNVYLVDGSWYYRSGGQWVVYRREPRALASVRVSYEAKYGRHYRPRHENASPPPHVHHRHH